MADKHANDYHHGDLYHSLISEAVRLLENKGVEAVSLREIAKQAGVSHTAPYRHFKNKQTLLASLSAVGFRRLADAMEKSAAQNPNNPLAQLHQANHAYLDLGIRHPEMIKLMFGGIVKQEEKTEELVNEAQRAFQGLLTLVENGIQGKLYRQHPAEEIALFIWSTIHGYTLLCSTNHLAEIASDKKRMHSLVDMLVTFMNEGIEKTRKK